MDLDDDEDEDDDDDVDEFQRVKCIGIRFYNNNNAN